MGSRRGQRTPSPLTRAERWFSLGGSVGAGIVVSWLTHLGWGFLTFVVLGLIINAVILARKGWR